MLLIQDDVTTDRTLDFVVSRLRERAPASLDGCVLCDTHECRLVETPIRDTGCAIPHEFVVGYRLDSRQRSRNLPFRCVPNPIVYARDHAGHPAPANGFG